MEARRVLHMVQGLGLGGTEKVAVTLARGLHESGRYETALWSPVDGPRAAEARSRGLKLFVGGDAARVLQRFAPHIAHLHRPGWPQPEFMRNVRAGLRFDSQGHRLPYLVETNVFGRHDPSPGGKLLDCTLFVSHFCAQRFAAFENKALGLPRYAVLYNPVDLDFFEAHSTAPEARDYSLPLCGRISRADRGKWSQLALDMLPLLLRRVPDCVFYIVGGIPEAEEQVRKHGLEAQVRFLPPLVNEVDLLAFFNGLSALAHANDTGESFGLVIAEAMATGLPVVTHACEAFKDNAQLELVEHERTGLVANTAEDYAAALAWLFAHPEQARRMGAAGREKVRKHYALRVVIRELEAVYERLLAGGPGDFAA